MAKQGMARPEREPIKKTIQDPPVPEIQGPARHGKEPVRPIISGTSGPHLKVYHELKGDGSVGDPKP